MYYNQWDCLLCIGVFAFIADFKRYSDMGDNGSSQKNMNGNGSDLQQASSNV